MKGRRRLCHHHRHCQSFFSLFRIFKSAPVDAIVQTIYGPKGFFNSATHVHWVQQQMSRPKRVNQVPSPSVSCPMSFSA